MISLQRSHRRSRRDSLAPDLGDDTLVIDVISDDDTARHERPVSFGPSAAYLERIAAALERLIYLDEFGQLQAGGIPQQPQ